MIIGRDAEMKSTAELHTNAEGVYSFERALLHVGLIEDLIRDSPRHKHQQITFMAGGPAAGKSTLTKRRGAPAGAAVIDPDDIRTRLPEYPRLLVEAPESAARLTHDEASAIAVQALAWGVCHGHELVIDAVGADDDGRFSRKIATALSAGYEVQVCYATVPVELALARAHERFKQTRRRVSPELIREKHAAVSRGLARVADLAVARIEIHDTSGAEPRLIAEGPGGAGLDALRSSTARRTLPS